MATGRISRLALVETGSRGRILRVSLTGVALPQGRIHRVSTSGTAAVILAAFPGASVEPLSAVTVTAVVQSGGTPTFVWRRVSGPAVTLSGTGSSRAFRAPALDAGGTLVLGVTATFEGTSSIEELVTIDIPPQIIWTRTGSTEWVPGVLARHP